MFFLRIKEALNNLIFQVFDFELTAEDMSELNSFPDKRYRGVELAWLVLVLSHDQ